MNLGNILKQIQALAKKFLGDVRGFVWEGTQTIELWIDQVSLSNLAGFYQALKNSPETSMLALNTEVGARSGRTVLLIEVCQ